MSDGIIRSTSDLVRDDDGNVLTISQLVEGDPRYELHECKNATWSGPRWRIEREIEPGVHRGFTVLRRVYRELGGV